METPNITEISYSRTLRGITIGATVRVQASEHEEEELAKLIVWVNARLSPPAWLTQWLTEAYPEAYGGPSG